MPRTRVCWPSGQIVLALVLYLSVSIAFFGWQVVGHLGSECACATHANGDPSAYMWFLSWWPHALLSGHNPFVTDGLWAPGQLDLGAVTLLPGGALVATPLTLLFGPLVAFNVLALAAPVLAALSAFLLCRYVSGSFAGALVGGYVFGFSTYMLGHMLGHLDLVQTFPIPAAVHLTLRLIDGRIGRRRFMGALAFLLITLLLCSLELALTFVLVGAAALAISFALLPHSRPRLAAVLAPAVGAGAVAALVASPFIYHGLTGPVVASIFNGDANRYGADVLGFVIPSKLTLLGGSPLSSVTAHWGGNLAEGGIYIGIPLMIVVASYGVARWRARGTRVLVAMLALVVVAMLGAHLHVGGDATIPLPWNWLDRLPLLDHVVPERLGVYMFLIVAIIATLWLAEPRSGSGGVVRWIVAAAAVAALVPNLGTESWQSRPNSPAFFTTSEYRSVLRDGENVLALPYAYLGDSMLWQAYTGMWFRQAGGYLGPLWRENYILPAFVAPQITPDPADIRAFLKLRQVGAVIVDPHHPQHWPATLAKLGLRPRSLGGVTIYIVPGARRLGPGTPG